MDSDSKNYEELVTEMAHLERSGRRYRELLDNISDAVISTDPEYTILSWNKAAEEIYGWSAEEAAGRIMGDLAEIRYLGISRDDVLRDFYENDFWEGETEQLTKTGEWKLIYSKIRLVRTQTGDPAEFVAVNRDVSHYRRAERKLFREKEINATLAEISKNIISPAMTIEEIAFLVYNAALKLTGSTYGYASSIDPEDEANVVHTFSEMMDKCDVSNKRTAFYKSESGYRGLWGHSLNSKTGFYTNTPERHGASAGIPEGHIPLENFLSVPALFDGRVLGQIALAGKREGYDDEDLEVIEKLANVYAIAIFRTQSENELHAAIEKMQESDRLKSTFLASISHEIRTPLNAIMGFVDIVLSDSKISDEQREYLQDAQKSGKILLKLINDILDFSKIEAGQLDLEEEQFLLEELFARIDFMGKELLKDKPIELRKQLPGSADISLYGDPYRLEQIFMNLISNAVKFTEQGSIDFGMMPPEEGGLCFFVRDTGVGITEEKRDIIFHAFRQAEEKTTRKYGGTGLGLAITKRLVGKMGGTIWFDSEEGKGTTFYFSLPFNENIEDNS